MPRKPNPATRSLWKDRLTRYECSGQSVREFCLSEGTPLASFYQWRRKLQPQSAAPVPAVSRFQAIQIVPSAAVLGHRPSIVRKRTPQRPLRALLTAAWAWRELLGRSPRLDGRERAGYGLRGRRWRRRSRTRRWSRRDCLRSLRSRRSDCRYWRMFSGCSLAQFHGSMGP